MSETPRPTLPESIRAHYRAILINAMVATVVVTAASFLIPNRFTAVTVLLPPGHQGDFSALVPGMPGGALTSMLGIDVPKGSDLYIGVLRSATVADSLIQRFGLMRVYDEKDLEKTARKLAEHTAFTLTGESFIRIAVTEKDKRLAADLANAYADQLDLFLRSNTNTSARRRREFLERRLTEARAELVLAENVLRDYQVQKRLPVVGSDIERSADTAGDLLGQKVSREVELGTLESVSRGPNSRSEELRNEIRQIDAEIMKIPPATTELARKYRDVKMNEKILLVLTEEYERARVMELKDMPTVEIVDRATPPLHKSQPRRALIAVGTFAIALAASAALGWARDDALRGVRPS
jgi:uncharacterized protein involved in exopolysaccharide biosynthesis